jgi:hypothetical protein
MCQPIKNLYTLRLFVKWAFESGLSKRRQASRNYAKVDSFAINWGKFLAGAPLACNPNY